MKKFYKIGTWTWKRLQILLKHKVRKHSKKTFRKRQKFQKHFHLEAVRLKNQKQFPIL